MSTVRGEHSTFVGRESARVVETTMRRVHNVFLPGRGRAHTATRPKIRAVTRFCLVKQDLFIFLWSRPREARNAAEREGRRRRRRMRQTGGLSRGCAQHKYLRQQGITRLSLSAVSVYCFAMAPFFPDGCRTNLYSGDDADLRSWIPPDRPGSARWRTANFVSVVFPKFEQQN